MPLGYFLTGQHVGRREVFGAVVIVIGLGLYAYFGDPAGGNSNAPNNEWAIAIGLVVVVSVVLLLLGRGGSLTVTAAATGPSRECCSGSRPL